MSKKDLALIKLQWLICHQTKPKPYQTKPNQTSSIFKRFFFYGPEDLEIRGEGERHPDYCIIKISQKTKMSPKDLRRLAVIQNPVKNYQITLVSKTLQGE